MAEFLIYRTQTDALMRARVLTRHPNGDTTVEPCFYQKNGKDDGLFQGGKDRIVLVPASTVVTKDDELAIALFLAEHIGSHGRTIESDPRRAFALLQPDAQDAYRRHGARLRAAIDALKIQGE